MTRRQAIRMGLLFSIGMALGKLDVLKAESGQLTVPLDQWRNVVFTYKGKKIVISVAEIFKTLQTLDEGEAS
jgi:hypothetical protein